MIDDNHAKSNAAGESDLCRLIAEIREQINTQNLKTAKNAYSRSVILEPADCANPVVLTVPRTWDRSTRKRTSAQLPDGLLRHTAFTLHFIFRTLLVYLKRSSSGHTVEQVCSEAGISISTLYRWKRRYLSRFRLWLVSLIRARPGIRARPEEPPYHATDMYSPKPPMYDDDNRKAAAFSP